MSNLQDGVFLPGEHGAAHSKPKYALLSKIVGRPQLRHTGHGEHGGAGSVR